MNNLEPFRDAIRSIGLIPPDVIEPGVMYRFPGKGKRNGNTAGWCRLHPDGLGGSFGDWSQDFKGNWQAERSTQFTQAERAAFARHVQESRAQAEVEKIAKQSEAAAMADSIWRAAQPAGSDHAYLKHKGIQAHGAKVHNGALVVPMREGAALRSLQFIGADGLKRFLTDGKKKGCYFSIGNPKGAAALCICEGFATGASIHEANGWPVAVAFDVGNLEAVALAIRARLPELALIICADDDANTEGNPGVTKATAAAIAVCGKLAIPIFGDNRPPKATDFNDMAAHCGKEAVERAIAGAIVPAMPAHQSSETNGNAADCEGHDWPILDPQARYGLAGEIVGAIEPNTESDSAAILIQTLLAFGVYIGRGSHVAVEGDQHHGNLFALLVGNTSKGRKGTSWGRVRQVFERLLDWVKTVSGLSSGEGLKWNVRDPVEGKDTADPGVSDKRLLVVESEFAQALRATARNGSTLSATIREAWDSGNLRTLTKSDPIVASGAYVAIIGHITATELRGELTETDRGNGFANRFLFVCVKRSKVLPFGGDALDEARMTDIVSRVQSAADAARRHGRAVGMTSAARTMWARVYPDLSEGLDGMLGAVTGRAEAQCLRLALLYALLDEQTQIDEQHLLAAIALWEYCQQSARFIFGGVIGNPQADKILLALRAAGNQGLTRTAIRDLFNRHQTAERIDAALNLLKQRNLAYVEELLTVGRSAELWRAGVATKAIKATKAPADVQESTLKSHMSLISQSVGA